MKSPEIRIMLSSALAINVIININTKTMPSKAVCVSRDEEVATS